MENWPSSEDKEGEITPEIQFSLSAEVQRVGQTLADLDWFREQGYLEAGLRLPTGVSEKSTESEVRVIVGMEFQENEAKYSELSHFIEKEWMMLEEGINSLRDLQDLNLPDQLTVMLTRYGTGGSYDSINGRVIINIESRTTEQVMSTISHELIHIGVQPLINKYNISHWKKERLVDLIGQKFFPGLRKMQNIKEDVGTVDEVFAKHFPDLKAIANEIGNKGV